MKRNFGNKLPLLRSEHFKGLQTQLTEQGLRFAERIGHEEREAESPNMDETLGEIDEYLNRLAKSSGPTKVVLNPRKPSAKALLGLFIKAQAKEMPDEAIRIAHGLPTRYDRSWERDLKREDEAEGQTLVIVAYDATQSVMLDLVSC